MNGSYSYNLIVVIAPTNFIVLWEIWHWHCVISVCLLGMDWLVSLLRHNYFFFLTYIYDACKSWLYYAQWCILVFGSADVMGNYHGEVREGRQSPLPQGENSLKQGPKPKQILKCGGGHWISPLWTVLKFKHQSVIWTFWVCTNLQKFCGIWVLGIWVTHKLKTGSCNTIIA